MQAICDIGPRRKDAAVKHAVSAHAISSRSTFFSGLEKEEDIVSANALLNQISDDANENCCMAVMPASVHDSRGGRRIVKTRFFKDRKSIHVGPQCDGVGTRLGGWQKSEDTRPAGKTCSVIDARRFERRHDALAGSVLLVHKLRMRVQVMPKARQEFQVVSDAVKGNH